jgi:hypothetical protein
MHGLDHLIIRLTHPMIGLNRLIQCRTHLTLRCNYPILHLNSRADALGYLTSSRRHPMCNQTAAGKRRECLVT